MKKNMKQIIGWLSVILLIWLLPQSGWAQGYPQKKIDVNYKGVDIKEVLKDLTRQVGIEFLYNHDEIKQVKPITLTLKQVTVAEVLDRCLAGTSLGHKLVDHIIVIAVKTEKEKKVQDMIKLTGKVTTGKGEALVGATVVVKGSTVGVATTMDGTYVLNVPVQKDMVLVFSFIGMKSKEVKIVPGTLVYNVNLEEDEVQMKDVIVTGYANVRRTSFTGNTTSVNREELLKTNNKNIISALQVFDPSLRIRENSLWGSDPNALPEFNIRGQSSIGMDKSLEVEAMKREQRVNLKNNPNLPIFILDGFEVSVQKVYDMDMNRVEGITILKDAAATAMYGSRAANGVIVITTIAPKPGEMRITYNLTGGFELPDLSDYNLCNAAEKLEVERLGGIYTADDPSSQADLDVEYGNMMNNILRGVDTDWLALPLKNVFNHKHSLYMEGGVETLRYAIDFNYDSNKGVMRGSYRDRLGVGLAIDYRYKKLQFRNYFSYNMTRTEDSPYGNFSEYADQLPYREIYDENGTVLKVFSGLLKKNNPLWKTTLNSYYGKGQIDEFTNNFNLNVYLLEGLQFKGQFSITKSNDETESFRDPLDPFFEDQTDKEKGSLSQDFGSSYNWNINAMFYYNREINKHFINAAAGANLQATHTESNAMEFIGFQLGSLNGSAYAAQQPDKTKASSADTRLIGILASLNYSYNNIYLLDASFRLDGSSQFGVDKRFAPFWSVGGGINIHNYEWLSDNGLLSLLKVRASYGSTGKVNFPAYTAITTYETDSRSWYFTGPASALVYLGNPSLKWETTKTLDTGIEMGFLNDNIRLTVDYYRKKTVDLIDEISIRASSGFDKYRSNSGSVVNKGFEIELNTTVYRDKDWMVNLTGNLASNKNEITELGAASEAYNKALNDNYNAKAADSDYKALQSTPVTRYYVGASTTAIYAVRSAGIDPANGKERFIRKNGTSTYTWNADDQVVVGDETPDAQGAFGINLSYRGIYLNTSFLYQWGAQIYNETLLNKVEKANIREKNVDRRVLTERWKRSGDVVPFYDIEANRVTKPTSRFVQNYNYLTFNTLAVGYDFKREMISRWGLASLGIRFNANDVWRLSSVREERGTIYPYARNFSFTLNIGL